MKQASQRAEMETTKLTSNVKIDLRSLVVDVAHDVDFDIYHYFGIEVPTTLIEEWDTDAPIPFHCEAECSIISNGRAVISPITHLSDQYSISHPTFPNISVLHHISREQHTFSWTSPVELPILYSELPVDSILSLKFYAKLFQTQPKLIGETSVHLFTQKKHKLRVGPFSLTFDGTEATLLQKHLRRLATGKERSYEFIDDQLRLVADSLHPKDADLFFTALLNPLVPPKLSDTSQFVRLTILSPLTDQSISIIHRDLILDTIRRNTINPCQRLYHDLARAQGTSKSVFLKDPNIIETLNKIKAMPPLADLQPFHKLSLVNHASLCLNDPALMPALFRSINWEEEGEETAQKLATIDPIDLEYALEFFTVRYEIKPVREYAIRCIRAVSRENLLLYIPQLLQAIKAKYTDGLADILVGHAHDDIIFASRLYWCAQIEPQNKELLEKILSESSPEVQSSLNAQIELTQKLETLLRENHTGDPDAIRQAIITALGSRPDLLNFPPVEFPLDPTIKVCGIDPSDVKVFQSKLKPAMLTFHVEGGGCYRVIFKIGDDMQQDQLIIQLFEVMDQIFRTASLQLFITAYKTLAFSNTFGCCQYIENSRAIQDITHPRKGQGQTIAQFLSPDGKPSDTQLEIFTASLAAYSVMTYVLRIGDRHNNNILVCKDGRLLHIDYGFILGDTAHPFSPPVKISDEMIQTIGEGGLQKLCGWVAPAFNSLRKRARLILALIELMFTAPLECFAQNPMRRLQQVENSLLLNCSELEAVNSLQATFEDALKSVGQAMNDVMHGLALMTKGGASAGTD